MDNSIDMSKTIITTTNLKVVAANNTLTHIQKFDKLKENLEVPEGLGFFDLSTRG